MLSSGAGLAYDLMIAAGRAAARPFRGLGAPRPAPVLPLSLFGSGQFGAANVVTFAVYGALAGALWLLPVELQQVSGYTALQAGISLLPVTAIMLVLSARSGALAARIGPRLPASAGPAVIAAGLALFTRIGPSGNYFTEVLPAVTNFGLGLAITVAPLTAAVLAAVSARHAGMASAVNTDVARTAALIAVAVLPAATGLTGIAYLHPARFSAGFGTALLISAGLCLAGGALAALTIRNPARRPPGSAAAALLTATSHWNPWQVAAPNRRRQRAIVVMIADRVRADQERRKKAPAGHHCIHARTEVICQVDRAACLRHAPGLRLRQPPRRATSLSMFAFAHQISPEATDSNKYLI